jgi:hypothetical protein
MYAIRERCGAEWWSARGWTPASDEALTFDSRAEAREYAESEDGPERFWTIVEM